MNAEAQTLTDDAAPVGALIRWPRRYDLLCVIAMAGRGSRVRTAIGDAADLRPGQRVLDVGCGTGTLTVAMAQRVGRAGSATGVDASPEMIEVARRKATSAAGPVVFEVSAAQTLPYPDESFDAVTSSLMIHHLPGPDQSPAVFEMLRVLRPGGTLVIAEFVPPRSAVGRHLTEHLLSHAMATNDLSAIVDVVNNAGAAVVQQQRTPLPWLGLVTGRKPEPNGLVQGSAD